MPSIRNVLFLLLTAGLGVGALLFARGSLLRAQPDVDDGTIVRGEDASVEGVNVARAAPEQLASLDSGGEPERVGPANGTTVIWPLEVELLLALPGSIETPEDGAAIRSGANAGIVGEVRDPYGRPTSATVSFLHGPNQGRVLVTDAEGRFGASNLWQGVSIVRVACPGGPRVEREVRLSQLNTTPFPVSFANASFVNGTVKDLRGVLLEGAEVRLDGRIAYTDIEGRFTFSSVPYGSILATVRKPGFATQRVRVGVGIGTAIEADKFVIMLAEAASMELSVGARAGSVESTYAVLLPSASPGPAGSTREFPWYEVNPVEIPPGGRAVVEGLPGDSVTVRVFHRGALGRPASVNVRLYEGRRTPLVLDLQPAPSILGVVLDEGSPVAGATVELEAANRDVATTQGLQQKNPRFALQYVLPSIPTAADVTTTDAKGRFSFTRYPDVITTYYVTATNRAGSRRGLGVVGPNDTELIVKLGAIENDMGVVQLEFPGRFQGLPYEVSVNGTPRDPAILRPGENLMIDGLESGVWHLRASWRGQDVISRRQVTVGAAPEALKGELPEGALIGQTQAERDRAAMGLR